MKICTFNVNSIRVRTGLIGEWLAYRNDDVDVLCFQELKTTEENFPYEDFEKRGYSCEVFGQKTYNGVAICSRVPVEATGKGFADPQWDEQKRIITAKIKQGGLHILNLYAPHGGLTGEERYEYKMAWYDRLQSFIEMSFSPKDPLLIVGDLNVAREDLDVFDPEELDGAIGTLPEERKALQHLLDWGLTDVYRHLHPDQVQFTWWNYIGGAIWKNEGMRIDYVLSTESVIGRIKEIEVDLWPRRRRQPKPSDHAPLIVTLDNPGK